jgi:hypothetical protein
MLQVFHLDVAKVDLNAEYVAMPIESPSLVLAN